MKNQVLLLGVLVSLGCNNEITGLEPPSNPATETFAASLGVNISQMTQHPTGVYYADVIVGSGDEAVIETDTVWVTYAGYLKDGKLFDSGTNVRFGTGDIVPGLKAGLLGMKAGGRRKIVIPSALGFGRFSRDGPDGKTLIPRQSTLIFDVDLLRVHTPTESEPTP
jgi:peptidylprolyl isomerase